jgi:hypothetical protein
MTDTVELAGTRSVFKGYDSDVEAEAHRRNALEADFLTRYIWQGQPFDALALTSPLHDGTPPAIGREIYHRMICRMGCSTLWGRALLVAFIAMILGLVAPLLSVASLNIMELAVPSLASWVVFLVALVGVFWKLAPMLRKGLIKPEMITEVAGVVERALVRKLPEGVPADLRDMWRHDWLTSEGRPISSEITEADARFDDAALYAQITIIALLCLAAAIASLAGNLILAGLAVIGFPAILIAADNPLAKRLNELEVQEAVEGVAYTQAGALPWANALEKAREAQLTESMRGTSPVVELGISSGLMAARGDPFAPSAGMAFSMSLRDLQQHLVVFGGTGTGKTSGVLMPIAKEAASWDKVGLIVMDGKGSLPNELAALHKLPNYKVIDPANTKLSLIGNLDPAAIVDTIHSILAGNSGDQFFNNSAAGLLRRAGVVARALGGIHWSLAGMATIAFQEEAMKAALEAVKKLPDETRIDPLLSEACVYLKAEWIPMDSRVKSSIVATARAWISTITAHRDLLLWAEAMPEEESVDLMSPLYGGRLGFLLPAHRYGRAGAVVSALLKARIYSELKARAERSGLQGKETDVVWLMDEAQEIATAEDATMLAIGRSLGLAVIAATQTVEGVVERLGIATANKWLTIFGSALTLAGRSSATDSFMADRAGSVWRLSVPSVQGLSVKTAIESHVTAGVIAAGRKQPSMSKIAQVPGMMLAKHAWVRFTNPIARALNGVQNGNFSGKQDPTTTLGAAPVIAPAELQTLLARPDSAFIQASRARVMRRDVIQLKPLRPVKPATEKQG